MQTSTSTTTKKTKHQHYATEATAISLNRVCEPQYTENQEAVFARGRTVVCRNAQTRRTRAGAVSVRASGRRGRGLRPSTEGGPVPPGTRPELKARKNYHAPVMTKTPLPVLFIAIFPSINNFYHVYLYY
jgi:hypothetical protein